MVLGCVDEQAQWLTITLGKTEQLYYLATGCACSHGWQVGPRFCLNPVRVFDGSFTGRTLYENPSYVSPNAVRAAAKRLAAGKYASKVSV
jgi:hypothetical protein